MPTWASSAKQMVGCALGRSRLWYTVGFGIVNEVYYPRADIPQIRDLGFIVADGAGFWVEVKRLHNCELRVPETGIPAVQVVHRHARFELALRITPDPERDVLLIEAALTGDDSLRPYVLLAPHVGGTGHDNQAEVQTYRGQRVLWAEQGPFGLALAAADERQSDAFGRASAGFVGTSDGWQDFQRNTVMTWSYQRAGPGNVALLGELPRRAVLALGLASSKEAAATLALSALAQSFETPWQAQIADWQAWHAACRASCSAADELPAAVGDIFKVSAMVLRVHQDKTYPGGMVASLSVPWGNSHDERGGYHLVWPRDLAECAGALLSLGGEREARDILRYLIASQHADGHWCQNQWLGGKCFWQGIQLDEAGFPVLLAAALAERGALADIEVEDMVRRALAFIARNGPASDQDRWEENAGVNTFTLAVCVAALVSGAQWLDPASRETALALADFWNASTEAWTSVQDTALARKYGVRGYFVRTAPAAALNDGPQEFAQHLPIKNRIEDPGLSAEEQVGTDFLQLVRFGLRGADDSMVCDSLTVCDALLKVETPSGPSWYRYNGDGYGEQPDGAPFDGTGQGRPWPLLTGERGHYELAAGRDPLPFLEAMVAMGSEAGMLPEQVWDAQPVPERGLYPGQPSGSAMPLAWAHAEFVKLVCSRALGRPFDRPQSVWSRYGGIRPQIDRLFWCQQAPIGRLPTGACLVVALHESGIVHWGTNGWTNVRDTETRATALDLHVAELPTADLRPGDVIDLTYHRATGDWAGRNYRIDVH